jgi:hypothetical protein
MGKHERTGNDQRSDNKNPTSPERKAAVDNRSVQIQNSKRKDK